MIIFYITTHTEWITLWRHESTASQITSISNACSTACLTKEWYEMSTLHGRNPQANDGFPPQRVSNTMPWRHHALPVRTGVWRTNAGDGWCTGTGGTDVTTGKWNENFVVMSRVSLDWAIRRIIHDDVIKWKHFPRYWSFVRGIHLSLVNFPHKGQWRGALVFSSICLNKRLSKQSWGWWFETPSRPLWRHCNALEVSKLWDLGLKITFLWYLIGTTSYQISERSSTYKSHISQPQYIVRQRPRTTISRKICPRNLTIFANKDIGQNFFLILGTRDISIRS